MDKKLQNHLLSLPQVVGVGQGFKEVKGVKTPDEAIVVLVKKKLPLDQLAQKERIPQKMDGFLTDVIEVGEFRAQAQEENLFDEATEYDYYLDNQRTSRNRPAVPGVSIGHYRVTAGTFGFVVYERNSNSPLILSNNHVLANSTNGRDGRARIGDRIYQPGILDGGRNSNNVIARLARFVRLKEYPRVNEVDCALARPVREEWIAPDILEIGKVMGVTKPVLGMSVKKSGRTTGLTQGFIRVLNVTSNVNYGQGRILRFVNQILTTPMSEGGDSGSLVVDEKNQAVGLLFAGSDQATLIQLRQCLNYSKLNSDVLIKKGYSNGYPFLKVHTLFTRKSNLSIILKRANKYY